MTTLSYLDYRKKNSDGKLVTVDDGTSVEVLIKNARQNLEEKIKKEGYTSEIKDAERQVAKLENAIKRDPELGRMVIANQTANMIDPDTGKEYEDGGINAFTIQDSLDNPSSVMVVYSGTGSKEWLEDGIDLSGKFVMNPQRKQAVTYFDTIVGKNGWDKKGIKIHLTGHSAGGNKIQYVAMDSQYWRLIDNGYSLDGEGMPPETIEYYKRLYGEKEFEERRHKLYSISADNDFVNVQGTNKKFGRVIPDENIYYRKSNLSGIGWHYSDCCMNEDGSSTEFTEQGIVSAYLESVSESIMDLPPQLRGIITEGIMSILQKYWQKKDPLNGEKISYAEIITSVYMVVEALPAATIDFLGDTFGVNLDWLAQVVSTYTILLYLPFNMVKYAVGLTLDYIEETIKICIDKIIEFGNKCKELTERIVSDINTIINNFRDWFDSVFNYGVKYANDNPVFVVETNKLRSYAQRINAVNSRISNLDSRLDQLYWKVNLWSLGNLIAADALTGYSYRLRRCVSYLNETADDLDNIENNLVGSLE